MIFAKLNAGSFGVVCHNALAWLGFFFRRLRAKCRRHSLSTFVGNACVLILCIEMNEPIFLGLDVATVISAIIMSHCANCCGALTPPSRFDIVYPAKYRGCHFHIASGWFRLSE